MKAKWLNWLGLEEDVEETRVDVNHAAAALMVEIMAADHQWDDIEAKQIILLLVTELKLSEKEASEILEECKEQQSKSHDLYQFTSVINDQYSNREKFELLKLLWKVAYADGQVDRYEEHMLRKLSDLLHLAHSQFIQAKIAARPSECS